MPKVLIESIRVFIALMLVLGGYFGLQRLKSMAPPPPKNERPPVTNLVETVAIDLRQGGLDIDVDGVAVPFREIPVAAEVGGRIIQMDNKVRAGKFVEEGEVLINLDDRDYKYEVARLKSEIAQALNSLRELEVDRSNTEELLKLAMQDLEIQERELGRAKSLRDRKAASDADVDNALKAVIVAKNGVEQIRNQQRALDSREERLQAGVELKQVQLQRAELDLARTEISAPISGVIVEAPAEEDAYVQRGAPLMTIEDTSRVEIRCQLKLNELFWLWRLSNQNASSASEELTSALQSPMDYEIPQAKATVSLLIGDRNGPQRFEWDAELSRFEGIGLDERTRTMPCRVVVNNPRAARRVSTVDKQSLPLAELDEMVSPPALIRGMFVDVRIHVPFNEPLLGIPDIAVRPGNRVWVYDPPKEKGTDGELRIVNVNVIRYTNDSMALVRKSDLLDVGSQVVVTPLVAAYHGMKVRNAKEQEDSPDAADSEAVDSSEPNANASTTEPKDDPA